MNKQALLKTKNELYQNSQLGRERLKLIEEYKNSIISVVDRLFTNTETGKKMIEMYPEQITDATGKEPIMQELPH